MHGELSLLKQGKALMFTKPKVYLAGAISGLTYDEAVNWREYAAQVLAPDIVAYSPLRQKHFLADVGVLDGSYAQNSLSTDRGIMTRDHWDCRTSDVILVNFLGSSKVSIGTCMEIAWAFAYNKPLVMVMEEKGNIHDHPMVREAIGYKVDTLDNGLAIVKAILLPETTGYEWPSN